MSSTVHRGPWDLSHKGSLDEERHRRRLREAIARQLPAVVGQVGQLPLDAGKEGLRVRFPVRMLELPRFRHAEPASPADAPGLGQGSAQPGEVVGRVPMAGPAGTAGADPADRETVVEVETELDALETWVWQALALPPPLPRAPGPLQTTSGHWASRRRHGPLATLDRKATLKAALARTQAAGLTLTLHNDDLRFRDRRPQTALGARAVVFLVRDASASMTADKRALAHAVSFWLVSWLRRRYRDLRLEFWIHDAQAHAVDERGFFHAVAAGGTRAASAYRAVAERIAQAFSPELWNIYGFHFTDGEDWEPEAAAAALTSVLPAFNLFGLVEVAPALYGRRLGAALEGADPARLRRVRVNRPEEVAGALIALLSNPGATEGQSREVPAHGPSLG